jgi:hypothetical protein
VAILQHTHFESGQSFYDRLPADTAEGALTKLQEDSARLIWVKTFVAAAEHKNLTKAGQFLGYSPKAVSDRIEALATWLRRILFFSGFPLELTSDGDIFLAEAKCISEIIERDNLEERFPNARIQSDGSVKVRNRAISDPAVLKVGSMMVGARAELSDKFHVVKRVDAKDIIF